MSYTRRPNPSQTWMFRSNENGGMYQGAMAVMPHASRLILEFSGRDGRRVFELATEDEEAFRRLLNERRRAREMDAEKVIPELHDQVRKLRDQLHAANAKLKEVLGEVGGNGG